MKQETKKNIKAIVALSQWIIFMLALFFCYGFHFISYPVFIVFATFLFIDMLITWRIVGANF